MLVLLAEVLRPLNSATEPGLSEAVLDDEFYRSRARHIRELADKADPFIRKRLLDLAGNYDAMVRRSHRMTALVSPDLPIIPINRSSGDAK